MHPTAPPGWSHTSEALSAGHGRHFTLRRESAPASFEDVIDAWCHNANFRAWFNGLLADTPFSAIRWETPHVTASMTAMRVFEFVVIEDRSLLRPSQPEVFAPHFEDDSVVVTFPNLGRDAVLVAPCPLGEFDAYGHLTAFVRGAPEGQRDALWQAVGEAMLVRVGARPVWLSTAGDGVSWLHVRLDDRPKYYAWGPYRQEP